MELKDFIKGVLSDITEAIKESQAELNNGAIINPTASNTDGNKVAVGKIDYRLQEVYFDVLVSVESEESSTTSGGLDIKIASIGANGQGRVAEEKTSRVKFSIPLVCPSVHVEKYEHPDNLKVRGSSIYL